MMALAAQVGSTEALSRDKIVKLDLGDGSKAYEVPHTILVNVSPWFAAALAPDRFEEGSTLRIDLHDTTKEVVEQFIYWLDHRQLSLDEACEGNKEDAIARITLLVHIWLFGDKHFLPALQNCAMLEMESNTTRVYPSLEAVQLAYELSPDDSAVRKLMMREVTEGFKRKLQYGETADGYTTEEVRSLLFIDAYSKDILEDLRYPFAVEGYRTFSRCELFVEE